MEYSSFHTGDEIRLKELFSGNNVVIIPDLQRDYCWGTEKTGNHSSNGHPDHSLATAFIWNLVNNGFLKESDLNLGLVYGYETPRGHIQLCDGQQRITTLFLLLGIINKKSSNHFQDQLISRFEFEEDDKEPYLQYSIRESSLYFLSDLVCEYFISDNTLSVSDIKSQNWYFKDYDLDPSIQSMLKTLYSIEEIISVIDEPQEFGNYILDRLTFMYYDMVSREVGEETFVIINTTGEPLSSTENLKPLYINRQHPGSQEDCCKKWEQWETWFWKQRKGNGSKTNDTAENGFKEFLRWITLLNNREQLEQIQETGEFSFDLSISPDTIDQYFKIINYLFQDIQLFGQEIDWLAPDVQDKNKNSQIVWFRLLPVVEYIKRWGSGDFRHVIRVKNFFQNLARIDNVSKAVGELLPRAIDIIKGMQDPDIAEIKKTQVSSQILTLEEQRKFEIYLSASDEASRHTLEDALWKAEEHKIWKGEILAMINWSNVSDIFDFNLFMQFDKIFNALFHDDDSYDKLDLIRRALLAQGLINHPYKYRGYANWSFCYEPSDWQSLIKNNEVQFGDFLFNLFDSPNLEDSLQSIIDQCHEEADWSEFAKIRELLAFCNKKNIQYNEKLESWILVRGDKTSGEHVNLKTYRLYLDFQANPFWSSKWSVNTYHYEGSSIHFHDELDIEIDVVYIGNELFEAQVFKKEDNQNPELLSIVQSNALTWKEERYYSAPMNRTEIQQLLQKITNRHIVE